MDCLTWCRRRLTWSDRETRVASNATVRQLGAAAARRWPSRRTLAEVAPWTSVGCSVARSTEALVTSVISRTPRFMCQARHSALAVGSVTWLLMAAGDCSGLVRAARCGLCVVVVLE